MNIFRRSGMPGVSIGRDFISIYVMENIGSPHNRRQSPRCNIDREVGMDQHHYHTCHPQATAGRLLKASNIGSLEIKRGFPQVSCGGSKPVKRIDRLASSTFTSQSPEYTSTFRQQYLQEALKEVLRLTRCCQLKKTTT